MSQSTWGAETPWMFDPTGFYAHTAAKPWYHMPLPTGLAGFVYRLTHRCRAVSVGVYGSEAYERCTCGALRYGSPTQFRWHPNRHHTLTIDIQSAWQLRNCRVRDITYLIKPVFARIPKEGATG